MLFCTHFLLEHYKFTMQMDIYKVTYWPYLHCDKNIDLPYPYFHGDWVHILYEPLLSWGDECRWKLKTLLLNRLKKQLFYSSFWKTIVKISWYLPRIRRLITSLLLSTTAYTQYLYTLFICKLKDSLFLYCTLYVPC